MRGPRGDVDWQEPCWRTGSVDKGEDYAIELGRRIAARRRVLGLSQEEMALEADYNRSYIGKIERGEKNVSLRTLCRLCIVLRCDIATLTAGIPRVIDPAIEGDRKNRQRRMI